MSTPINQLPTNNQETSNERELVNEILKEINENDTNQIPMKEPSMVNENDITPQIDMNNDSNNQMPIDNVPQNLAPQIQANESNNTHDQFLENQNFNLNQEPEVEVELSLLDKIRTQGKELLIVLAVVTLLGMLNQNIITTLTPMISKISFLNNYSSLIMNILIGIIAAALFFILKNNI